MPDRIVPDSEAITSLRPGASIGYKPDGSLRIDSMEGAMPSADEIAKAKRSIQVREKRAREYPAIADQLDALWKGGADADAMRAAINAVKNSNPKP